MPHTLTPELWPSLTPYATALTCLEALAAEVAAGAPEQLIFCEHEPVLTLGSSAKAGDAGSGHSIATHTSSRGGQVTYHGPGQRVIYPVVRLDARWGGATGGDVRVYMQALMDWLQAACTQLGVPTEKRQGEALGLWVKDAKIAAFGVKVRKGVAYHGAALNVLNDLEIYKHFTPCGLPGSTATRLIDHAHHVSKGLTMAAVDDALRVMLPVFLGHK